MRQISGQLSKLQKLSLVKSVKFIFQVNGTLKITAREVRNEEKERKVMVKTHLDLVLSSISTVVVIICLILLSWLEASKLNKTYRFLVIFIHVHSESNLTLELNYELDY